MATYAELAYDILDILRNSNISDDENITIDHILFHFDTQRDLWLRNEYNKPGRSIDVQIEQDLNCLELELADTADCCEIQTGCSILRTKKEIPKLVEFHNGIGLTRVGLVSKIKVPFSVIPYERVPYAAFSKYFKGVYAFLLNKRIYLLTSNEYDFLDFINVRGVFSNPRDLIDFKCDDDSCFSYDDEYPLNSWMIPYIKEQVLKQFGMSIQMPSDESNDSSNNLKKA